VEFQGTGIYLLFILNVFSNDTTRYIRYIYRFT